MKDFLKDLKIFLERFVDRFLKDFLTELLTEFLTDFWTALLTDFENIKGKMPQMTNVFLVEAFSRALCNTISKFNSV